MFDRVSMAIARQPRHCEPAWQSTFLARKRKMDCFAAPLLAMTADALRTNGLGAIHA